MPAPVFNPRASPSHQSNRYEALDFPLTQLLYEAAVAVLVSPAQLPNIQKLYPIPSPPPADFRVFASSVLTDGLFYCPTRNATEAMLAAQPGRRSKSYHYVYSHLMSWSSTMWGNASWGASCYTEVCHGSDLPQLFLPTEKPSPAFGNYTDAEWALGLAMQQFYANFAASGVPGEVGGVAWPAYNAGTRQSLNYQTSDAGGITVASSVRSEFCSFWDALGYNIY